MDVVAIGSALVYGNLHGLVLQDLALAHGFCAFEFGLFQRVLLAISLDAILRWRRRSLSLGASGVIAVRLGGSICVSHGSVTSGIQGGQVQSVVLLRLSDVLLFGLQQPFDADNGDVHSMCLPDFGAYLVGVLVGVDYMGDALHDGGHCGVCSEGFCCSLVLVLTANKWSTKGNAAVFQR